MLVSVSVSDRLKECIRIRDEVWIGIRISIMSGIGVSTRVTTLLLSKVRTTVRTVVKVKLGLRLF